MKANPNGPCGPWFGHLAKPNGVFIVILTGQYVKSGSFCRKLLHGMGIRVNGRYFRFRAHNQSADNGKYKDFVST